MEFGHLLEQVLQQYGLTGMLITFLIIGPIYTYIRTHNLQIRTETKAYEILNGYAQKESARADHLSEQLQTALMKLDQAEDTVFQLQLRVRENKNQIQAIPKLRRQSLQLKKRIEELENTLQKKESENLNAAKTTTPKSIAKDELNS
jgi:hypothetical protein